ncbi:MAG: thioredoxin domain-containing protein [Candidatus Moduliflexus flocculans]|nr:thioredoxin domain-containing protein [Candidatus Moduliflexus flocculans]
MSIQLTNSNFQQEVLQSELPATVDFWAISRVRAKFLLGPTIEQISVDLAGKVKVGKVNVDDEPALANALSHLLDSDRHAFQGGKKPAGQVAGPREQGKPPQADWD